MMKVKLFDESHEQDLEDAINEFLDTIDEDDIVDIRYSISTMYDYKDQIYCYSALILYRTN
ncbi:MAG: sporulation protein Cse60 [Bacilli bacterium]|nr:sporulation protein Cse60 [Bacilli bacterium]